MALVVSRIDHSDYHFGPFLLPSYSIGMSGISNSGSGRSVSISVLSPLSTTGESPHVIRGTAAKDKYVASCDENEDEDGNVTTKTVVSERPRLVIRVLDCQRNITTLE